MGGDALEEDSVGGFVPPPVKPPQRRLRASYELDELASGAHAQMGMPSEGEVDKAEDIEEVSSRSSCEKSLTSG